jgi:lysozyme
MSAVDIARRFEGCERDNGDGTYSSYWDFYGKVWTIGFGTTGAHVTAGLVWTYAQCEEALETRMAEARAELLAISPKVAWVPGAQDALTDFVYNEGIGRYKGSTVRAAAERGDWATVKLRLLDWDEAAGTIMPGLLKRRKAEADLIQITHSFADANGR